MREDFDRPPSFSRRVCGAALLSVLVSCVVFRKVDVRPVDSHQSVTSPVKAHLSDGSTILYPHGFTVVGDTVRANGFRYAAGSSTATPSTFVTLDSVVGMETFETNVRIAPTVLVSTPLSLVAGTAALAGLKVLFGSCPTFYSDSSSIPVLEAEGFSYSIAPLFEQRTVARLRGTPTAQGQLALVVRNEALETHYLNHIGLLEATHRPDEYVAPRDDGSALALSRLVVPASVHDRVGRDLAGMIAAADDHVFATSAHTLDAATISDLEDHIDLAFAKPAGADSIAVLLRMRNSLLNTVLLYDQILGAPGAQSLDWLAHDLQRVTTALTMGRWYGSRMGMRIAVMEHGAYRPVARIGDSGPIAFHEVAVLVPALASGQDDSVHIRLSFIVDQWRIDQIRVALAYRRPVTRAIPLTEVVTDDSTQRANVRRDLADADERYVVTSPGQSITLRFDVGAARVTESRTFLLASQGYYTEWVRGEWIRTASRSRFTADDASLMAAIAKWRSGKDSFERTFYATRVAVK